MDAGQGYWGRVSRRRFLGTTLVAGAGLASAALIGCSSSGGGSTGTRWGGAPAASRGPRANDIIGKNGGNRDGGMTPKYGGTLNGAYNAPPLANLDPLASASGMVHMVA